MKRRHKRGVSIGSSLDNPITAEQTLTPDVKSLKAHKSSVGRVQSRSATSLSVMKKEEPVVQTGVGYPSVVRPESKSPQSDSIQHFLKPRLQNRKTCRIDLSHKTFYGNLFDKLNLNEDDLDDMIDRTFDLEPFTSYNSLIEYLKSKPDRFKR